MVTRFSMGSAGRQTRSGVWFGAWFWRRMWLVAVVLLMVANVASAKASGPNEDILDASAILQLEHQADRANPREQCLLYTQVLHSLTELAGRQLAHGEEDAAGLTLLRIDTLAQRISQTSSGDARRLKAAEQLMEHTQRRLNDMLRVASSDERVAMQSTMQHINSLHEHMLALVFSR